MKFTLQSMQSRDLECVHGVVQPPSLSKLRTFSLPHKASPCFPSPTSLSPQIRLFWTFHTHGILQRGVLCNWLLSLSGMFPGFIHAAACVSNSLLSVGQQSFLRTYPTWFIHSAADDREACLQFLATIHNAARTTDKFLCRPAFLFPLATHRSGAANSSSRVLRNCLPSVHTTSPSRQQRCRSLVVLSMSTGPQQYLGQFS